MTMVSPILRSWRQTPGSVRAEIKGVATQCICPSVIRQIRAFNALKIENESLSNVRTLVEKVIVYDKF